MGLPLSRQPQVSMLRGVRQNCRTLSQLRTVEARPHVLATHPSDIHNRDLLRTRRLTFAMVGAVAEPFDIHLLDHPPDALLPFGPTLRQQRKLRHLCTEEECCRCIRTSCNTGP